jgi:hypothetical protein
MYYDPFSEFYTWIGIALLIGGLIAVLKIGAWVWLATRVFHRPAPPSYEPPTHSADSLKKWLSVIATVLGIISTTVGLVKGCQPNRRETPSGYQQPPQQPYEIGSACCTYGGNCMLMAPAPVGSVCTCFDLMGNMAQGTVCR